MKNLNKLTAKKNKNIVDIVKASIIFCVLILFISTFIIGNLLKTI